MKYLKLLLQLRDVSTVYQEEKGQSKPFYLSRRFIGVVIAFLAAGYMAFTGATLADADVTKLSDAISEVIPAAIALYGAVMAIVGQICKPKRTE